MRPSRLGLIFAAWAVVSELREPYRVLLDDEAVSFLAGARRTVRPWPQLAGVTFRAGNHGGRLVWVFADEGGLTMPAAVPTCTTCWSRWSSGCPTPRS